MSARDDILNAFEHILIAEGERAATLDAVAARAEVSKGGLLYHFRSKDALADGLIDRLRQLSADDLAAMQAAPEGPSAYYVATSVYQDSDFDRALIAATRLIRDAHPGAREAMQEIQRSWFDLIAAEVGDAAIARAILLLGDGLYYNATLSGGPPTVPVAAGGDTADGTAGDTAGDESTEGIAALLEVVELLKQQAAARR